MVSAVRVGMKEIGKFLILFVAVVNVGVMMVVGRGDLYRCSPVSAVRAIGAATRSSRLEGNLSHHKGLWRGRQAS